MQQYYFFGYECNDQDVAQGILKNVLYINRWFQKKITNFIKYYCEIVKIRKIETLLESLHLSRSQKKFLNSYYNALNQTFMHQNIIQRHQNNQQKKKKNTQLINPHLYFDSLPITNQYIKPFTQTFNDITYKLQDLQSEKILEVNLQVDMKKNSEQKQIYHSMIGEKLLRSLKMFWKQKIQQNENIHLWDSEIDDQKYEEYWKEVKLKKFYKSFVSKKYQIKNQIIIIEISHEDQQDINKYNIIFKNVLGNILFFLNNIRIDLVESELIQKFQHIFDRSGNLFYILNKNKQNILNLFYLYKLVDHSNEFIYVQKFYKIFPERQQQIHQQNEMYQYDLEINKKIYLIQRGQDMIILSRKALSLYFNEEFQKLMKKQFQLKEKEQKILKEIFIQGQESENINVYLKYLVFNQILLTQYSKIQINIINIFLQLIKKQRIIANDCKKKISQDLEENIEQHYPKLMENCKICKVCSKRAKQKSFNKKNQIKNIKIKGNKKTKYCCQGCSIQYGKNIPLCVICFKQFHKDIKYYLQPSEYIKKKFNSSETTTLIKNELPINTEFYTILNYIIKELNQLKNKFSQIKVINPKSPVYFNNNNQHQNQS